MRQSSAAGADGHCGGRQRPRLNRRGCPMQHSQPLDSVDLRSGNVVAPVPEADRGVDDIGDRSSPRPPATLAAIGDLSARPQRSLWVDAWRRLRKNKLAVIGLTIIVVFIVVASLAPLIAPYGESEVVDPRLARMHPSWTFPFGLTRMAAIFSAAWSTERRVSLLVGVLAQASCWPLASLSARFRLFRRRDR